MDVNTGHLISGESLKLYEKHLRELRELEKEPIQNYEPVPDELHLAAKKKLAGKDEAMVSLTSGGKLSKWAAKKRKEKRRMANQSKKANRR